MNITYLATPTGATLTANGITASVIKLNAKASNQNVKGYQIPGYRIYLTGCDDQEVLKPMADYYIQRVIAPNQKFYDTRYKADGKG